MWSSHFLKLAKLSLNTGTTEYLANNKKAYLYPIWWGGTIRIRWVFSHRTWQLERFKYRCMCYPISFVLHESQANEKTFHQTSLMSSRNVPELIIMLIKIFKRPSNSGKANINGRRVINQRYWLRCTGIWWISFTRGHFSWNWLKIKLTKEGVSMQCSSESYHKLCARTSDSFSSNPNPKPGDWTNCENTKQYFIWWVHD